MERTLYLCDPVKNTKCGNRCYLNFECEETFNKEFAKLDEKGEPIVTGKIIVKDSEVSVDEARTT